MSATDNKLRRVNIFEKEENIVISIPKSKAFEGRNWILEHKNTPVMDTPLWVLLSLGIIATVEEDKKEEKNE